MKSLPSLKFAVLSGGLVALSAFVSPMYGALIVQTATYHASDYSGSVVTNGSSGNLIDRLELTSAFNRSILHSAHWTRRLWHFR